MYLRYLPIARQLYDEAKEGFEKKSFYYEDYSKEKFIEHLSYKIRSYTTNYAVGESYANISFPLIKCLKTFDLEVGQAIEKEYVKTLSTKIFRNDVCALCQMYFHCSQERLKNTLKLITNYYSSFKTDKLDIDEKTFSIIPMLSEIAYATKVDQVKMSEYVSVLNEFDLTEFCDRVEEKAKNHFVEELNEEINPTLFWLKSDSSRVKFMNGQDFNLLIHCASYPEMLLDEKSNHGFSLSLIDDKNIRCYSRGAVKFAFYTQLSANDVALAATADIGTIYDDNGLWGSSINSQYLSIKDFKQKTKEGEGLQGYSEISTSTYLKPSAIVCYDYVSEREYEVAQQYGLDLIIIQTEKYNDMSKDLDMVDKRFRREVDPSKLQQMIDESSPTTEIE